MNYHLRADKQAIQVVDVRVVPPSFHCRHDARYREYVYRIFHNTKDHTSLFEEDRALFVPERLDVDAMSEAASMLIGEHDFASFRGMACEASSSVRCLDMLDVRDRKATSAEFFRRERYLTVTGRARSFLHRQMRIMVGFLIAVGKGKESPDRAKELLRLCDRSHAPATAPAHGLYLKWIDYDWEMLSMRSKLDKLAATQGDDWAQAAAEDVARQRKAAADMSAAVAASVRAPGGNEGRGDGGKPSR